MDKDTDDRLKKIRSNYDALASEYAREISVELDHRPLERKLLEICRSVRGADLRSRLWPRARYGILETIQRKCDRT